MNYSENFTEKYLKSMTCHRDAFRKPLRINEVGQFREKNFCGFEPGYSERSSAGVSGITDVAENFRTMANSKRRSVSLRLVE